MLVEEVKFLDMVYFSSAKLMHVEEICKEFLQGGDLHREREEERGGHHHQRCAHEIPSQ